MESTQDPNIASGGATMRLCSFVPSHFAQDAEKVAYEAAERLHGEFCGGFMSSGIHCLKGTFETGVVDGEIPAGGLILVLPATCDFDDGLRQMDKRKLDKHTRIIIVGGSAAARRQFSARGCQMSEIDPGLPINDITVKIRNMA